MSKADKPLVSIIAGYYNREHLVDDSIQSLIKQTYENIEIIIFDDCSTDNTYRELKKFKTHPNVKLIRHETNIGFTKGLIRAITNSNGEYIAIHGSGDISFEARIAEQVKFLKNNNDYGFVAPRFERIDEVTKELIETSNFTGEIKYRDFLKKSRFTHGSVLFKKDVYLKVGGYEEVFTWVQDMDLFTRMLRMSKGYVIDEILYKQYTRSDGTSVNPSKLLVQAKFATLRVLIAKNHKMRDEILQNVQENGVNNFIENRNVHFQSIIYQKLIRIIHLGRVNEYRELKHYLHKDVLPVQKKMNLIIHEFAYYIIKLNCVEKHQVIVFFKFTLSAKKAAAKLYFRFISNK